MQFVKTKGRSSWTLLYRRGHCDRIHVKYAHILKNNLGSPVPHKGLRLRKKRYPLLEWPNFDSESISGPNIHNS